MLAYPTPTFDAKTILQAPGYRPAGRGACYEYQEQPEAVTPLNLVNRGTTNGGFVGTRAKKFIQNNQFLPDRFDPTKGTPLSKPGSVGNVGDLAISVDPIWAEPTNGELKAILNILNGKPAIGEHIGKLSVKQIESLERKAKPRNVPGAKIVDEKGEIKVLDLPGVEGAKKVIEDFSDAREALRKETMIRKAERQGFSLEEARDAYRRLRMKEAEATLLKEEDPSIRLYDLIDSRVGGTQNGTVRSNDETGLSLAKGNNAVLIKKAEAVNNKLDRMVKFDELPVYRKLGTEMGFTTQLSPIKEDKQPRGRPKKASGMRGMRKLTEFEGFGKLK